MATLAQKEPLEYPTTLGVQCSHVLYLHYNITIFLNISQMLAFLVTMNGQKIRVVNVTQSDCVALARIALSHAALRKPCFSYGRFFLCTFLNAT